MNAKPKLTDAMRAYFVEVGRKGGRKVSGEAKRQAGRRGGLARTARANAARQFHTELHGISREIGSFLDELTLRGPAEERRKELCDRLYSILQSGKIKVEP